MCSIPGLGRSLGGGNGNPPQYSRLENPTERGAWRATVLGLQRVGHDWSDLAHMHADANGDRSVHMSKCVSVYLEKYPWILIAAAAAAAKSLQSQFK